jgi:hypothetical protein
VGRASPEPEIENIGLRANGSSGAWEVSIDETISGRNRWFVQIEGRSVYLYFEIPSLEIVAKIISFLTPVQAGRPRIGNLPSRSSKGVLKISKAKGNSVTLISDDEYIDRYFLVVGPTASPLARLTLAGKDLRNLISALSQIEEELTAPSALDGKKNNQPQQR